MNWRRIWIGLMLCVVVGVGLPGRVSGSSKGNVHQARTAADSRPFDCGLQSLPTKYSGHDLKAVYKKVALKNDVLRRSEFETVEAYEARKNKVFAEIGLYAYSERPSSEGGKPATTYDAEHERFTIRKPVPDRLWGVQEQKKAGSYIAQTIGGAKVRVDSIRARQWDLVLRSTYHGNISANSNYLSYDFDCPRNKAPSAKEQVRLLYIYQPIEAKHDHSSSGAEWPVLIERQTDTFAVVGIIWEIWVYYFNTGQVIWREKWHDETAAGP